jgi:hypothetical protein
MGVAVSLFNFIFCRSIVGGSRRVYFHAGAFAQSGGQKSTRGLGLSIKTAGSIPRDGCGGFSAQSGSFFPLSCFIPEWKGNFCAPDDRIIASFGINRRELSQDWDAKDVAKMDIVWILGYLFTNPSCEL